MVVVKFSVCWASCKLGFLSGGGGSGSGFFLSPVPPTGEPAPQVLPFWTELIPELWNWTVAAAAAGILELEPYYLLPPVLFIFWPFLTYYYYYWWFSKLSGTNWFCF
jgi:hypothetical protein